MLHDLPPEIFQLILKRCNFIALLHLRQLSLFCKNAAEVEISIRFELDVAVDYSGLFDDCDDTKWIPMINSTRMVEFIQKYMSHLRRLSLRHAHVVLTLADLIQLASAVPYLEALDLSQMEKRPHLEKDAILALPYFKNLKHLRLDGFVVQETAGRGCSHRYDIPPLHLMRNLESVQMESEYESILRMLLTLREHQTVLYKLTAIDLTAKHCSAIFPEVLIWFLHHHRSLSYIRINNALFATSDQLRRFYNSILTLAKLKYLRLDNCTSCDRVDATLQIHFLKTLNRRGIDAAGVVRSMRFDPDNNG
ncbi:hypothetical protein AB6A40_001538 [Gnathostoma spinigerum]|uniref:F-box domain-containing protein n=1 Tax=Gnathostoma spinigerum TaxID=75299 RepID=A0ABD6E9K3_9BILA